MDRHKYHLTRITVLAMRHQPSAMYRRAFCLLLFSALLLFGMRSDALASSEAETMWLVENVDTAGSEGLGCFAMNVSLALDIDNNPHVSYYRDDALIYAHRSSAGWDKTIADDTEAVGRSSSIALDSSGKPHIAYRDLTKNTLKYASWDGVKWNLAVAGKAGWYPSLALDSADHPHISYMGSEPQVQAPNYAYRVDEHWQNTVIEDTFSSSGTSLALDSFEHPHAVYNSYWDLNYGILSDTTWMTETIDSSDLGTPAYPSIALDTTDNPHISYEYESDLKYAYKKDGVWEEELPDSKGNVGSFSAIALDTQEYPRISYFDDSKQAVKHAQWNGSSWLVTVVDSPVLMDGYTSLAVDQGGYSHIFYCDDASATVRYSRQVAYDHQLFVPFVSLSESSPEPGKIAFLVGPLDGSSSEIHTMNSIGGDVAKLTEGIPRVGVPIWSLDGSKIAFEVQPVEPKSDIYVVNADGSNSVNITNNPTIDANPSWNSDGSRIVFERWGQNPSDFSAVELYTVNADGSDPRKLTDNTQMDYLPSWSPDGTKIAFEVYTAERKMAIHVMNADGTNITKVTDDTYGEPDERYWVLWQGEPPAWSPDSSKFAFVSNENGNMEIYVVGADGTGLTNLTTHPAVDKRPRWSPDGSKIAFASDRAGGPPEIYTMNADGSNPMQLTNNSAIDSFPSWSTDGSKIAFDGDRDGSRGIYVMNADGSNQKRISSTTYPIATFPVWSPR